MAAYFSKFTTAYINGGATPNMTDAWKPLNFKAFRASFTLVAAQYIGPADAAELSGLFLGHGGRAVQAVAQADDLCLPFCQGSFDDP